MTERDPLTLLSLRDAAAVLGIEPAAVRRLVDEGHIGAYFSGTSGVPRIPRRSLEVWHDRIAQGLSGSSRPLTRPEKANKAPRRSTRKHFPKPTPISVNGA